MWSLAPQPCCHLRLTFTLALSSQELASKYIERTLLDHCYSSIFFLSSLALLAVVNCFFILLFSSYHDFYSYRYSETVVVFFRWGNNISKPSCYWHTNEALKQTRDIPDRENNEKQKQNWMWKQRISEYGQVIWFERCEKWESTKCIVFAKNVDGLHDRWRKRFGKQRKKTLRMLRVQFQKSLCMIGNTNIWRPVRGKKVQSWRITEANTAFGLDIRLMPNSGNSLTDHYMSLRSLKKWLTEMKSHPIEKYYCAKLCALLYQAPVTSKKASGANRNNYSLVHV